MKNPVFLLTILFTFSFIQNRANTRLIWSQYEHTVNALGNHTSASATDALGNSYIVNATQDQSSLYETIRFFAYDSSGTKLWQFNGDSCLNTCHEEYNFIVPMAGSGALFIGSYSDNTGAVQLRLTRIDQNGILMWQQFWITPYLAITPVVSLLDNNGDLLVAVNAYVDSVSEEDFVLAKFDTAAGLLSWHTQLADAGAPFGTLSEEITAIAIDNHNTIYGCGQGSNPISMIAENYLFSVSDAGNINYRITTGFSGANSSIDKLVADDYGHVYISGTINQDSYVEKYDATPSLIWSRTISRDTAEKSMADFVTHNGNLYVLENYRYFHPDNSPTGGYWSNFHYMLTGFDSSGIVLFSREYLSDIDSVARQDGSGGAVQLTVCNDDFFVLSSEQLDGSANHYAVIHKINLSGGSVWFDTTSINENPGRLTFDSECNAYLNYSYDAHSGTVHSYLNKYADVLINSVSLPDKSYSASLHPNPFSNSITIHLSDESAEANGQFTLLSMQGIVLHTGRFTESTDLDFSHLPSGAYMIRVTEADKLTVSKVILKQ